MSRINKISADEARWRAEDDARTLQRAMEIQKDSGRMKAAHKVTMDNLKTVEAAAKLTGSMVKSKKKGRKK